MGNKNNRFLSAISIILLFAVVAALYVVPSIQAIKGFGVLTISSSQEETDSQKAKDESTTVISKTDEKDSIADENKEITEEESPLFVKRDLLVHGYHIVIDAYDGYGSIRVPSSLNDDDLAAGLSIASNSLGYVANEISFKVEGKTIDLVYNQGHTEEEINAIIDKVQDALGAIKIDVPDKPELEVEDQKFDEYENTIERKLELYSTDILALVSNEDAIFTYPKGIASIDEVVDLIVDFLSTLSIDSFDCDISDGEVLIHLDREYSKDDIDYALDRLQEYFDLLESKVDTKEEPVADVTLPIVPAVPKAPTLTVASQALLGDATVNHIHRDIALYGTTISADAYDGYAVFNHTLAIEEDELASELSSLLTLYPSLLSDFDFALSDKSVEAYYPNGYTVREINSLLDSLEAIARSLDEEAKAKEPPLATGFDIDIEKYLVAEPIKRVIDASGIEIKAEVYDGYARLAYDSSAISEEDAADALVILYGKFSPELASFDFALSEGLTEVLFPEGNSDDELNWYVDQLEAFIESLMSTEKDKEETVVEEAPIVPAVPKAPTLTVASQALLGDATVNHIHRDIALYGTTISADAYDGYAVFNHTLAIEEDELASELSSLLTLYPSLLSDFDFALSDKSVEAYYPNGYTVREINSLLDSLEAIARSLDEEAKAKEPPLATGFDIDIEKYLVAEPIKRVIDASGIEIKAEVYDGYARLAYDSSAISEEDAADALVILYGKFSPELASFDFALSEGLTEVLFPEGNSDDELNWYVDQLEAFIESLMSTEKDKEETVVEEAPIVPAVPKAPTLTVASQALNPIKISRSMQLFDYPVTVEVSNNEAYFVFPEFVSEEDITNCVVGLCVKYNDILKDFDFMVGNNTLVATFANKYTEDEINNFLDFIESMLASFSPVNQNTNDGSNLIRTYSYDGLSIEANASDGYAVFSGIDDLDQEKAASFLVGLYQNFGAKMADFDFALDSDSIIAIYSNGYTDSEISSFLDAIETYIESIE